LINFKIARQLEINKLDGLFWMEFMVNNVMQIYNTSAINQMDKILMTWEKLNP
jgi:hypothetical protein